MPKLNFPSEDIALGTLPTTVVENEGLMTNKIQEQVVQTRAPRIPTPRNINPYINQAPKQILERMYDAGSFTISPATAESAFQFVPPMFDQPQFIKAISSFRYIRWKSVHFTVQTLVSPFTYGWFGITGVPWSNDGTYNQRDGLLSTDFGNLSHDDAIICDVSSGNQFELDIPWAFTSEWMDTMKLSYSLNAFNPYAAFKRMCSLKLFYIFQAITSLNSTVPAQLNGIVFSRFDGVEVAGPRQTTEISPPSMQFQSGLKHYDDPEGEVFRFQSQAGTIGPAIGVLGTATMGILGSGLHNYMNRQVGNAIGTAVDGAAEAAGEVIAPFLPEIVEEPGEPLTQNGIDDGESQSTNVVPSVFGSMGYSKSVNVLGCGSMRLCGKGNRNSIKRIIMKPSFLNLFSIPYNLSSPIQFELDPFGTGQICTTSDITVQRSCSRIRFFANFFRMWRGTVKYSLVFISSPLVTWKFKILITYGPTIPVLGDVISQVITVKGSTVYDFSVPYLYINPWRLCSKPTSYTTTSVVDEASPAMYISLAAAPVSSGDVHPVMQVLMYQAAGDDFQFACPKDPMPYEAGDAPLQFQMRVSSLCKEDLIVQGSGKSPQYYADNILSCESLAKRWSTRFIEEYDGPDPAYQSSFGGNNFAYSCLDAMSTLFLYWHGQYKLKMQFTTDPENPPPSNFLSLNMVMLPYTISNPVTSPMDGVERAQRFCDGSHVISADLTQVLEVTVPFISSTEWVPCWRIDQTGPDSIYSGFNVGASQMLFTPRIYTAGSATGYQFPLEFMAIAAGSDFVFSYDLPPPSSATRWYDTFPPDMRAKPETNKPEAVAALKSNKKKIDSLHPGTDPISELLASCANLRTQRRSKSEKKDRP